MNYVCKVEDLDKLLPGDRHGGLVKEFINLFSNNWRLRYVPRKEYWEEVPKDPDDTDEEWKNKRRGILERKRNAERKNQRNQQQKPQAAVTFSPCFPSALIGCMKPFIIVCHNSLFLK